MIKQATILDLSEINELMSELEGIDCHEYVRMTLLNPNIYWFYKKDTAIVYEVMDNHRYNVHIYNRCRGDKELRNWFLKTALIMFDLGAKNLMNFVKEDRRDLRFFMSFLGSNVIGKIGNEIIYNFSRDIDRDKIERRIK